MTSTETKTIASAEHNGHTIEIVETTYPTFVSRSWVLDGQSFRGPVGTVEQVIAKARKLFDERDEDDAMLSDLTELVANHPGTDDGSAMIPLTDPAVGQVAWVHAMGYFRRGRIIKVSRTRVTVAYTTASSGGRVFRKATNDARALSLTALADR